MTEKYESLGSANAPNVDREVVLSPKEREAWNLWMSHNILRELADLAKAAAERGARPQPWLALLLKTEDSELIARRLDELAGSVFKQANKEYLPQDVYSPPPISS